MKKHGVAWERVTPCSAFTPPKKILKKGLTLTLRNSLCYNHHEGDDNDDDRP